MSESRSRVLLMGSGAFGVPSFAAVAARHEVLGLVTQPARPAGRRRKLTPTPAAEWAQAAGLKVWDTDNAGSETMLQELAALHPEVALVIAFGQKLSNPLLDALGGLAINLHASLLPAFRGAAPIQRAMLAGVRQTGNSIITLASRMDAGDILATQSTAIEPTETAGELHDRLSEMAPPMVLQVIEAIAAGRVQRTPQDESQATRAPKLAKSDGWVDFSRSAHAVACRINGLNPWPGVEVLLHRPSGEPQPVMLRRARAVDRSPGGRTPGALLEGLEVVAADGVVELLELQRPGGRVMDAKAFLAGMGGAVEPGCRLESVHPVPDSAQG